MNKKTEPVEGKSALQGNGEELYFEIISVPDDNQLTQAEKDEPDGK